jgi:hypothetical protein
MTDRDRLVKRWHEVIQQLTLVSDPTERAELIRELRDLETQAMKLILGEQQQTTGTTGPGDTTDG